VLIGLAVLAALAYAVLQLGWMARVFFEDRANLPLLSGGQPYHTGIRRQAYLEALSPPAWGLTLLTVRASRSWEIQGLGLPGRRSRPRAVVRRQFGPHLRVMLNAQQWPSRR
jgi:hypothetical protein